jgi:isoleucyl-tRNA synthetase
LKYSIAPFNEIWKTSILAYTKEWKTYVQRQARWVDLDNAYKTMDLNFMESVIWAFSELYKKGLVYEGNKVMPYSWALETPLSNFETRLDNAYRMPQDTAITVAFTLKPLENESGLTENCPLKILAWTTIPWTLPANLALAVGENISYSV